MAFRVGSRARRPSLPSPHELDEERIARLQGTRLWEPGSILIEDLDPALPDYFAAGLYNAFFRDADPEDDTIDYWDYLPPGTIDVIIWEPAPGGVAVVAPFGASQTTLVSAAVPIPPGLDIGVIVILGSTSANVTVQAKIRWFAEDDEENPIAVTEGTVKLANKDTLRWLKIARPTIAKAASFAALVLVFTATGGASVKLFGATLHPLLPSMAAGPEDGPGTVEPQQVPVRVGAAASGNRSSTFRPIDVEVPDGADVAGRFLVGLLSYDDSFLTPGLHEKVQAELKAALPGLSILEEATVHRDGGAAGDRYGHIVFHKLLGSGELPATGAVLSLPLADLALSSLGSTSYANDGSASVAIPLPTGAGVGAPARVGAPAITSSLSGTSHDLLLPDGANDTRKTLLMVLAHSDQATEDVASQLVSAGWTQHQLDSWPGTNNPEFGVFSRKGSASFPATGATVPVTTVGSAIVTAYTELLSGVGAATPFVDVISGNGTVDPPNLSPSWLTTPTRYLAFALAGDPLSGTPAGYVQEGSLTATDWFWQVWAKTAAAAENPGALSSTDPLTALTIGIRGEDVATDLSLLVMLAWDNYLNVDVEAAMTAAGFTNLAAPTVSQTTPDYRSNWWTRKLTGTEGWASEGQTLDFTLAQPANVTAFVDLLDNLDGAAFEYVPGSSGDPDPGSLSDAADDPTQPARYYTAMVTDGGAITSGPSGYQGVADVGVGDIALRVDRKDGTAAAEDPDAYGAEGVKLTWLLRIRGTIVPDGITFRWGTALYENVNRIDGAVSFDATNPADAPSFTPDWPSFIPAMWLLHITTEDAVGSDPTGYTNLTGTDMDSGQNAARLLQRDGANTSAAHDPPAFGLGSTDAWLGSIVLAGVPGSGEAFTRWPIATATGLTASYQGFPTLEGTAEFMIDGLIVQPDSYDPVTGIVVFDRAPSFASAITQSGVAR